MKTKTIVIFIVSLTLVVCVGLFSLFNFQQQASIAKNITYTSIVVEKGTFYAYVPDNFNKNKAVLKNAQGRSIDAQLEWQENRIVAIRNLQNGTYSFEIENKKEQKNESVQFEVKAFPEQIRSKAELQQYFKAVNEVKHVLSAPYLLKEPGFFDRFGVVTEESKNDAASSEADSAGSDYSETNNQVAGIEEGDIAVSNGTYAFSLTDQTVQIIQPKPLKKVGEIILNDTNYIEKLFTYKDYLIIQTINYEQNEGKSTVSIYNVANPTKPEKVHQFGQDGYAISSRLYDGTFYLVSSYAVYEDVGIIPETKVNNTTTELPVEDIAIYPTTLSEQYTVLSKLDLNSLKAQTKAFLGAGQEMYMSENAIYLTATDYSFMPMMSTQVLEDRAMPEILGGGQTTITKYAIAEDIKKVAETEIEGHLLNQFAMDESNGYFRVAATAGSANLNDPARNSENFIYIFDKNLKEVSRLDNLARGERIYSVRFMGDKGYMVTFVETDPLFVIDLANPEKPVVLGELKIPGYSNYLHPIGENHLLGIGYDTAIRSDGKNRFVENLGMKLTLFNVTNPANPTEQQVEIIGGQGTHSNVQHDHKALYRDLKFNRYGFDLTLYDGGVFKGHGTIFYQINENGITNKQAYLEKAQNQQYEQWENMVKRILYVNDQTLIIYNDKVATYARDSLQPLETISLIN